MLVSLMWVPGLFMDSMIVLARPLWNIVRGVSDRQLHAAHDVCTLITGFLSHSTSRESHVEGGVEVSTVVAWTSVSVVSLVARQDAL